jgi:hypothetical protein
MAKAKRNGGKGFGKSPKLPGLDKSFDFDGLANGDLVLGANVIAHESKGVGDIFRLLSYGEIAETLPGFKAFIDMASSPALIHLAQRRQLEEGRGLLTLTPRSFRQQWGLADPTDGPLIFNWWTIAELNIAEGRSYVFGGSRIIAGLAKHLTGHSKDRFPVICHAAPFTTDGHEKNHSHLLFTVSFDPKQAVKQQEVYLLERENQPLTELLMPNSEPSEQDLGEQSDRTTNENLSAVRSLVK